MAHVYILVFKNKSIQNCSQGDHGALGTPSAHRQAQAWGVQQVQVMFAKN